jgi:UrcA family protein
MYSNVKTARRMPLAITTAVLLACVAVSTARANEEPRSEIVKFADLNVDTPSGAQTLYGRIHAAAKRVCWDSDPTWQRAVAACAREAEAKAVAKVGLPQLTAIYQMKTGQQPLPVIANR